MPPRKTARFSAGALLTEITAELPAQGFAVRLADPLPPTRIRDEPVALTRALRNLIINAGRRSFADAAGQLGGHPHR